MNPFLAPFETPFQTIPFKIIKNEHFIPALKQLIEKSRNEIENICNENNPDFHNTIEALENSGRELSVLSSTFFNLNSAETNDEIQNIVEYYKRKFIW